MQIASDHEDEYLYQNFWRVALVSDVAVKFTNVSKRFRLGESHDSLRDLFSSWFRRLIGRDSGSNGKDEFWALRDVDFTVRQGEALGIIGPNGAGKSTALKLLAGILRPEHGAVEVNGRLAALIEVGAGFHGDLTGRENIFLNGAILGMTRAEIRSKLDAIVAFAGLEPFIDTPVKRYSSGMYARLGFSIASHVDPDILLVDEVLSVGDAVFRLRCLDRMHELLRNGTTLVFVTHYLEQMQSICHRAIVLEHGSTAFEGSARDAVGHYLEAMSRTYAARPTDFADFGGGQSGLVEAIDLSFHVDTGDASVWVRARAPLRARLNFRVDRHIPRLVVELNMRASANDNLLSLNSGRSGAFLDVRPGAHTVELSLPRLPVRGGQYFWNVRMWDADRGTTELDTPFRYPLVVDDEGLATGTLALEHEWSLLDRPRSESVDGERPARVAAVPEYVQP